MTAPVVTHQAEMTAPGRHLVVPHMQIGAERIRQHQHRGVFRSFDFDINAATVVSFYVWHSRPPSRLGRRIASQKTGLGSTWEARQGGWEAPRGPHLTIA